MHLKSKLFDSPLRFLEPEIARSRILFIEEICVRRPRLRGILSKTIEKLIDDNSSTAGAFTHRALWFGMAKDLEIDAADPANGDTGEWDIFLVLLARLWAVADAAEKNSLAGRIEYGATAEQTLVPLYSEFAIAAAFLHDGFDVDFIASENGAGKAPDLAIEKMLQKYQVEIKTVNYLTGLPFKRQKLLDCFRKLTSADSSQLIADACINIQFTGERQSADFGSELEACVLRAAKEGKASNRSFTVSCKPLSALEHVELRAEETPPGQMRLYLPNNALAILDVRERWTLPQKISARMNDASKQLTRTSESLIWIQIYGMPGDEIGVHSRIESMALEKAIFETGVEIGARTNGQVVGFFVSGGTRHGRDEKGELCLVLPSAFVRAGDTNSSRVFFSLMLMTKSANRGESIRLTSTNQLSS